MTMRSLLLTTALGVCLAGPPSLGGQHDYPATPLSLDEVHLHDAFWSQRLKTNREITVPFELGQCTLTGRMRNFEIAAGHERGEQSGIFPFDDSDPYKVIEGASSVLGAGYDANLDASLDRMIASIAAAQEPDGYLYTPRTNHAERLGWWTGKERWTSLSRSHELYNAGHLYEAAVAHYRATGKRTLLDVALRNADLVCSVFGPGKLRLPSGHQEVEIGLVKLYHVTGREEYLRTAKFFLDERGHADNGRSLWGEYAQDHKPIADQDEAVGHAVRAAYMYSGITDVGVSTGDNRYVNIVDRIWENVIGKKIYLTGGIGASGFGESLGENYDLPNFSAYCETCASIANVLWNERMFLLHEDGKYFDVLERTLYNALIAGVSMEGDRFFYPNVLASRGSHERLPWFDCSCCPTNVVRLIPTLPSYMYARGDRTVFVNMYVSSEARIPFGADTVSITQDTRYPWDGSVSIAVAAERPVRFALRLRIPGWAANRPVPSDLYSFGRHDDDPVTLMVNGNATAVNPVKGYARIDREWKQGDTVTLHLPMPVRRVYANASVRQDVGRVAVQRGPIVYCAEWADNPGGHVLNLVLPKDAELRSEFRPGLLNGVQVITGTARSMVTDADGSTRSDTAAITLIPYYAWAHRGKGEMVVWLAEENAKAEPVGGPWPSGRWTASSSGGAGLNALNDGVTSGAGEPFFQWSGNSDTMWVQYDAPDVYEFSEVEVYWLDAAGSAVPLSWRLMAYADNRWQRVWSPQKVFGVDTGKYNRVAFETSRSNSIRLEAVFPHGQNGGIREWRIR